MICLELESSTLAKLRENVFPLYRSFLGELEQSEELLARTVEELFSDEVDDEHPGVPMCEAAASWAEEFDLRAPWVVESVCSLMHFWTLDESYQGIAFQVFYPWGHLLSAKDIRFRISLPGWIPGLEQKGAAKKRINRSFQQMRDLYFERLDENAKKLGIKPPRQKRNRDTKLEHRMKWLARYLVQGWGYDEILKEYKRTTGIDYDKSNLAKMMKSLAKDLGLPYPNHPTGRRKKTDSENR
jgi:hypothetical protein